VARTVNAAEQAARRDAILNAAERLILTTGYERLTVQDILEELRISKGAFYHYFDSKSAVIEALTEQLVAESERALAPIVEDPDIAALEKLQRFSNAIARWKSLRQNLLATMLTIWYAPDNTAFRLLVDRATAKRLAPLLSAIVRQGVDEHQFATAYPDHAGAIIVAVLQALQDKTAHQLLAATRRSPGAPKVKEIVATHAAHIEAIERYLGVPAGALYRTDARTVRSWITALQQADTTAVKGAR
jgi:AcrR family transcriptional regulator